MVDKEIRELFIRVIVWLDTPQDGYPKKLVNDINNLLNRDNSKDSDIGKK